MFKGSLRIKPLNPRIVANGLCISPIFTSLPEWIGKMPKLANGPPEKLLQELGEVSYTQHPSPLALCRNRLPLLEERSGPRRGPSHLAADFVFEARRFSAFGRWLRLNAWLDGCGSNIGTQNGLPCTWKHGLKSAVPWWFHIDPTQIAATSYPMLHTRQAMSLFSLQFPFLQGVSTFVASVPPSLETLPELPQLMNK